MKSLLKLVLALSVAAICAGHAYAAVTANNNYETVVYHERFHAGDTFNDIISHYYNHATCGDWDEWQSMQKRRNKRLFFKADGSVRYPQPGDIVCIEIRECVAR